jgi:hypothetical protein
MEVIFLAYWAVLFFVACEIYNRSGTDNNINRLIWPNWYSPKYLCTQSNLCMNRVAYNYHSVNVISLNLFQSDHIRRLSLHCTRISRTSSRFEFKVKGTATLFLTGVYPQLWGRSMLQLSRILAAGSHRAKGFFFVKSLFLFTLCTKYCMIYQKFKKKRGMHQ